MNILQYNDVEILRKELVVLKHVTFSLEEGEFAYLMGRVGSGKSSLMKSIYAEIPVSTGQAEVMGTSLVGIRRKQIPLLRRNIGIVFQDFQLLTDRSVYDNLRFVLDATGWRDRVEIDDRIDQVLHQVGMQNKSYKMPHELSGGEQQRIVIARALLNRPKLILADEPTGNLDARNADSIFQLLGELNRLQGTAFLVVTHDLQLAKRMSRQLEMRDGRLTAELSLMGAE